MSGFEIVLALAVITILLMNIEKLEADKKEREQSRPYVQLPQVIYEQRPPIQYVQLPQDVYLDRSGNPR